MKLVWRFDPEDTDRVGDLVEGMSHDFLVRYHIARNITREKAVDLTPEAIWLTPLEEIVSAICEMWAKRLARRCRCGRLGYGETVFESFPEVEASLWRDGRPVPKLREAIPEEPWVLARCTVG